ncbi:MAG: Hsp20/alpha crystallin family protein [Schleiferiaceae bacterium]|nr:Hsp20/alpha crystallin family protein [Schleiferiaceae bacterium]MDR9441596.1 Hsp20/alpha crystallin family protein [Schleiferiaceae bacterium]
MTLIKRNDASFLPNLWEDFFDSDWMGGLAPRRNLGTMPAVNIKDEADHIALELAAPGMKKDDFKVDLEHNVLTISAEQKEEHEDRGENSAYTRREFNYQSFSRSFTLPDSVKTDKISAKYHDGVLNIHIPKKDEAKAQPARQIEIK